MEDRLKRAMRGYTEGIDVRTDGFTRIEEKIEDHRRARVRQRVALAAVGAAAAVVLAIVALGGPGTRPVVKPVASPASMPATPVPTPAPSPRGAVMPAQLVAAARDGRIVLLDSESGRLVRTVARIQAAGFAGVSATSDRGAVFVGVRERDCANDDDRAGRIVRVSMDGSTEEVARGLYPALSADGRRLAYASSPCDPRRAPVTVRELATGAERTWAEEPKEGFVPTGYVTGISWAPDSRRLAYSRDWEGEVTWILDTAGGTKLPDEAVRGEAGGRPAWRGETLAMLELCCYPEFEHPDRVVEVDPGSGRTTRLLELPKGSVTEIDFDSAGRFLLYVTKTGELWRWDGQRKTKVAAGDYAAADW